MNEGSLVLIEYIPNGQSAVNITSYCIWNRCSFDMQMNAQPGTFTLTVRDINQELSFITGARIRFSLDGVPVFGGYVMQVSQTFLFPVDDTSDVENVRTRAWVLRGSDYNILFDKRVLRSDTGDFTKRLPSFTADHKDGWFIKKMCDRFLDLPSEFNTNNVQEVSYLYFQESDKTDKYGNLIPYPAADKKYQWVQQGTTFRQQIQQIADIASCVYYIDAEMSLHYKAIEQNECMWGFSDVPSNCPLENSAYKNGKWRWLWKSTIGFRDMELIVDGSQMVNDALVWGGKALTTGDIVFARKKDNDGIAQYGRWQMAEDRIGQDNYGTRQNVRMRAQRIIGDDDDQLSGVAEGMQRGLSRPQYNARLSWFAHDLPFYPLDHPDKNERAYLRPGQFVNFLLYTFGSGAPGNRTPMWKMLPVRQISVSFVNLDQNGKGYVRFDGTFAISQSDPWNLWKFYQQAEERRRYIPFQATQGIVNDDSTSVSYNDLGMFSVTPKPNGSAKLFSIKFGYISGTLEVSVNGNKQVLGTNYVEVSPESGTFRMMKAPEQGDWIMVQCRTLEG